VIQEVNGWEEDEDLWDEEDDNPENEWVLDCGLKGCLMPGYHFRHECHTAEMLEAFNAECEASKASE